MPAITMYISTGRVIPKSYITDIQTDNEIPVRLKEKKMYVSGNPLTPAKTPSRGPDFNE